MKGWIYFLQFGMDGPVKVGRSYNPVARAQDLNATSPVELVLLGALRSRDMCREEHELHDRLSEFRVRGEWFDQVAVLAEMKRLAPRLKTGEALSIGLCSDPTSTGRALRVNLRLSQRLFEIIQKAAKQEQRSFNSMFEVIVTAWDAKQSSTKPRTDTERSRAARPKERS